MENNKGDREKEGSDHPRGGQRVVIIKKTDYEEEIMKLLSVTNTYKLTQG